MSLFKVRDIWSSSVASEGDGSKFCITLGTLNASSSLENFIIVGCYSGIISVFFPHYTKQSNLGALPYEGSADLCVEYNTNFPIINIACGTFHHSANGGQQIATLHPDRLQMYNFHGFSNISGDKSNEHMHSYLMKLNYEQKLDIHPFSMCVYRSTSFRSSDKICIQNIDSSISIISESGSIMNFSLPEVLIPGCLVFLRSTDSFIFSYTSRRLVSVGCTNLVNYGSGDEAQTSHNNLLQNWSAVFQEPLVDLDVIEIESNNQKEFPTSYVTILCRNKVLLLSETGLLLSSRTVENKNMQIFAYGVVPNDMHLSSDSSVACKYTNCTWEPRYLITTQHKQLLVFKGTQLMWSALLPWSPVDLLLPKQISVNEKSVLTIGSGFPPGMIVILSSEGMISMIYLGTDPSISSATENSAIKSRESVNNKAVEEMVLSLNYLTDGENSADYDKMNEEMSKLNLHLSEFLTSSKLTATESKIRSDALTSLPDKSSELTKRKLTIDIPKLTLVANICSNSNELIGSEKIVQSIQVTVGLSNLFTLEQFSLLYLIAYSNQPIILNPDYINLLNNKSTNLNNSSLIEMNINENENCTQINCIINCSINSQSFLNEQIPLDLCAYFILCYKFSENNMENYPSEVNFVQTEIRLPLSFYIDCIPIDKISYFTNYCLLFHLSGEIISKITNLTDILSMNMLKKSSTQSSSLLGLCFQFPSLDETNQKCVYMSLNSNKSQLLFETNYPELFWPIINEFFIEFNNFKQSKNISTHFNHISLIEIQISKSDKEFVRIINPFLNYFYENITKHIQLRLDLATKTANLNLYARYLRNIENQIFIRIENNLSSELSLLNNYNLLLNTNLNNLIDNCDQIEQIQNLQINSSIIIISIMNLLIFLSFFYNNEFNLNQILQFIKCMELNSLLSISYATNQLENIRGNKMLHNLNSIENLTDAITNSYIGLEECIQSQIDNLLEILIKHTEKNQENELNFKPISCENIPDVKYITNQLFNLCKKIQNVGLKTCLEIFKF